MQKATSKYQHDFERFFHKDMGYKILADPDQYGYVEAILAPTDEVQAVFVDAPSGTGKSSIALSAAYYLLSQGDIGKIVYVRNTVSLRENGFLPGTSEEKEQIYMKPLVECINRIGASIGDQGLYESLAGQEQIIGTSTSYLRGTDIEGDAVLIIDEAQNLDLNELRTVLTRVHDTVKVIIIGSHLQVDNPHIEKFGPKGILPFELYMEHFKKQGKFNVKEIELNTNYRGEFANYSDSIHNTIKEMNELRKEETRMHGSVWQEPHRISSLW